MEVFLSWQLSIRVASEGSPWWQLSLSRAHLAASLQHAAHFVPASIPYATEHSQMITEVLHDGTRPPPSTHAPHVCPQTYARLRA
eukprot:scaffold45554_cov21-Tisochrysis_lutea.AAC.1